MTDLTRLVEVRRGVLPRSFVEEEAERGFGVIARVLRGEAVADVLAHYNEKPGRGSVPIAEFPTGLCPASLLGVDVAARLLPDHCRLRYVDPADPAARAYAPKHCDGQFVPGASVNVVIPLTTFGGPAPGLIIKARERPLTFYVPTLEPGDVLLLGSEVEHWRHIHEGMTRVRLNIEYRVAV